MAPGSFRSLHAFIIDVPIALDPSHSSPVAPTVTRQWGCHRCVMVLGRVPLRWRYLHAVNGKGPRSSTLTHPHCWRMLRVRSPALRTWNGPAACRVWMVYRSSRLACTATGVSSGHATCIERMAAGSCSRVRLRSRERRNFSLGRAAATRLCVMLGKPALHRRAGSQGPGSLDS
ncbi:hypothetical protein B0H17DRAFT_1195405 [Mycena rosella]|uniref:Uncharacterized protein n=1 Tax=Mycena rosella TaxID=1033263 RepID=A0AAD7DW26_MYCRO|nr:hypothetical protein B0H17DRAFT_1195405 [Mycena rosella]